MERFFLLDAAGTATDAAEGMGAGSLLLMLVPYALIIVALYFIMIRPQSKKRKKKVDFLLLSFLVINFQLFREKFIIFRSK